MNHEQLFIGGVGVAFGSGLLVAAAIDSSWFFELPKVNGFSRRFGRLAARLFYGAVGLGLAAIGIGIASGFRVAW